MTESQMDRARVLFLETKAKIVPKFRTSIPTFFATQWIGPIGERTSWEKHMFFYPKSVKFWDRNDFKYYMRVDDNKDEIGIGISCFNTKRDFKGWSDFKKGEFELYWNSIKVPNLQIDFDPDKIIGRSNEKIIEHTITYNNSITSDDLYEVLENIIDNTKSDLDKNIEKINNMEDDLDSSQKSTIKLIQSKKQVILQGPPGTGKTYSAKDFAEHLIYNSISSDKKEQKRKLEESDQFSLVQFHPSYSYEDFVRGISAKSEGGSIVYETENKVLASFAQKALNNLDAVNKDFKLLSKEQQIEKLILQFADKVQDTIDESESYPITPAVSILRVENDAFRYAGEWKVIQRMKFTDLVVAQLNGVTSRQELKQLRGVSGLAKQHASYFIKVLNSFQNEFKAELKKSTVDSIEKPILKNYILIIDEINRANLPSILGELIYALEYRNESVESIYALDGDNSITIPENLYIIGTMNTADRSVGHIDYAIKRRFAFVDILPREDVINNDKSKELFKMVTNLFVKEKDGKKLNSDFLASDFEFKDVQLGHSYFILKPGTDEVQTEELSMRLKYEIVPILHEYVKDGLLLDTAKEKIEEISRFEC